ncbi:unnamed protein product [Blepharisma stoltei]|uniref:Maturase K n=1 Tax=Blepharisma stoltei TaxID=1481888 RepID=A0AAU9J4H1_9CILI|nr:unnamed protein product [Blepharisma stoltei]
MSKIEWNICSFFNERKPLSLLLWLFRRKVENNLNLIFYYYFPSHYADLIYYYSSEYRNSWMLILWHQIYLSHDNFRFFNILFLKHRNHF